MSDGDERDHSRERERRRERPSRFSEAKRDRSPDRGKDRGGMKSSNCRVYVSNIPYEYRWQDLKDLFRSHVGDVAFVELFVDENDKPRGCGIVEFSDSESVKKCLEVMHRFELKGRKIVIKEDFGNQRDKYGNLVGPGSKRMRDRDDGRDHRREDRRSFDMNSSSRSNSDSKWGYTYGLSPQFLESLNIHHPLTNRVFVANLDYKVTKKKLKEVFRLAGKVQRVDLSVDKDGKSRGFAVVEYDHPVESVQAISMFHNQELYDRVMTVRMDRASDAIPKLPEGLKSLGMGLGPNGEPMKDVARTVPSMNNNNNQGAQQGSNSGPGILGAVPALQTGLMNASALTNLNNVGSALGNLNTSAVLQAANLAGVTGGLSNNLLTNTLGAGDLSLAANLVNNPLVQNQSLAALAANTQNALGNPSNMNSNYNTQTPSFQTANMPPQNNYGSANRGNYDNRYDNKSAFSFTGNGRDNRNTNYNPNNDPIIRTQTSVNMDRKCSPKIIISNLPPTANYKVITDKCQDFGDVQRVEDKSNGSVVVTFGNEWDAERAIRSPIYNRTSLSNSAYQACLTNKFDRVWVEFGSLLTDDEFDGFLHSPQDTINRFVTCSTPSQTCMMNYFNKLV